ncbi:hypothetical protein [Haloplanus natans]|uniref:hypothetical protein n=1 Tax=Haloplanus natans TaxID=376171 RepID=UPI000677EE0C
MAGQNSDSTPPESAADEGHDDVLADQFSTDEVNQRVVAEASDEHAGEAFLRDWADTHGLDDVAITVDPGAVEPAIDRAVTDGTMLMMGATEGGSALPSGSELVASGRDPRRGLLGAFGRTSLGAVDPRPTVRRSVP